MAKSPGELVQFIARYLVEDPDSVQVKEVEGEKTIVVELHVPEKELGRVIGKQGRTAKAMRTILGVAGSVSEKKIMLEIME